MMIDDFYKYLRTLSKVEITIHQTIHSNHIIPLVILLLFTGLKTIVRSMIQQFKKVAGMLKMVYVKAD